jgi:hypothetical protein
MDRARGAIMSATLVPFPQETTVGDLIDSR